MRLYPKKLRSIDDLEKEKKRLLKDVKALEEQDLLSFEGIFGNKGAKEDGAEGGSMFDLLNFLPISNPLFDVGIKLAKSWYAKRGERKKEKERSESGEKEKQSGERGKKSALRSIAVEVIGGYLKWKAIELSFKGIRHILKKRSTE